MRIIILYSFMYKEYIHEVILDKHDRSSWSFPKPLAFAALASLRWPTGRASGEENVDHQWSPSLST